MTDKVTKRLQTDLSEGYDDVVRGLARMTKHLGADAGDAVSKSATTFVHAAAALAEEMRKQSVVLAKKAGKEIQEHPVATATIAAAAVGLLGYAVTHRRKPKKTAVAK